MTAVLELGYWPRTTSQLVRLLCADIISSTAPSPNHQR
jgi:hypothetical protein